MQVAIYARVSSEDQQERGTIENQVEFARKYCDLHQYEITQWYKDDGVTGTIPLEDRDAGNRVLEGAKLKRYEILLIYKLDRLGRSARIILNSVYELEQCGVKIKSMTEPFDTGDPNGRFLLTILAGVADLERETILERLWYGANRAARNGKWLGGIVPYGYKLNDDKELEINYDQLPCLNMSEADVIKLIYRLIAEEGQSTIKVAEYLNALGIPPSYTKDGRTVTKNRRKVKTAGIWYPGRIRNMVVNTTYKGIHQYGKRTNKVRELITRQVPAIVSKDTWAKAQQVLKDNQIEAVRNSRRNYLLRGLIKCGICGLTYHGTAYKGPGGRLKGYYECGGKTIYRGPLKVKCTSKNIPQAWIEDIVWQRCVDFIHNPKEALREFTSGIDQRKSEKEAVAVEKEIVARAIQDKEDEKQSILDLYRKKIISSTDVEQQLSKISHEKEALEQQIRRLNREIENENNLESEYSNIEKLLKSFRKKINNSSNFRLHREIVKTLVKEVIVDTKTNEFGRLRADVIVKYVFSQDVTRNDRGSLKL